MNKEDTLRQEYSKLIANPDKAYQQNPTIFKAAHTAMDIYAKSTSIEFAEWIDGHAECFLHTDENEKFWELKDGKRNKSFTTSQLFDMFMETKNPGN